MQEFYRRLWDFKNLVNAQSSTTKTEALELKYKTPGLTDDIYDV